jgi:hypothetical protein
MCSNHGGKAWDVPSQWPLGRHLEATHGWAQNTYYRGFKTMASIVVVRRKLMCGSPVAQTLKTHGRDTTRYILVRASEPTGSSVVIFVLGMPNQGITMAEIERDWYPSACRCSSLVSKKLAFSS